MTIRVSAHLAVKCRFDTMFVRQVQKVAKPMRRAGPASHEAAPPDLDLLLLRPRLFGLGKFDAEDAVGAGGLIS